MREVKVKFGHIRINKSDHYDMGDPTGHSFTGQLSVGPHLQNLNYISQ